MTATANQEEPDWVWPSPAASSASTVELSAPAMLNRTASKSKSSYLRPLPSLLNQSIHGDSSVLIAGSADCKARRNLILALDGLVLRRGYIAREGDEEIARDALLNGDICARRSLARSTRKHGIDGKLGDACNLRDAAGHLAAYLRCDQRLRCLICRSRSGVVGLGGGTECQQVDDVDRVQRGIGRVGGVQMIDGPPEAHRYVELLYGRVQSEVDHRLRLRRIDELNGAPVENEPVAVENDVAAA